MKKKIIIGVIISGIFLYLSVRKIDFSMVLDAFGNANYYWSIPTAVIIILTHWLRALRWRYLLYDMKPIGHASLFSSVVIGFMANNVLPVRLGEIVRALSISRKEDISRSGAFATVMVERIFDSFAILFMLAVCIIIFPFPEAITRIGYIGFAFNCVIFALLLILSKWPQAGHRAIKFIVSVFPERIRDFTIRLYDRFVSGLGVFHDWRKALAVSVYTAVIWVITAISNYFVFVAFDLNPPLIAPFVVLVIVAFAVMLPSSPGFIGTFQYGCMVALSLFGIPKEISFPFSVILWSCQYFPVTLLGLYFLRKESFSLKSVSREKVV